jgi:hypothetical protein
LAASLQSFGFWICFEFRASVSALYNGPQWSISASADRWRGVDPGAVVRYGNPITGEEGIQRRKTPYGACRENSRKEKFKLGLSPFRDFCLQSSLMI